MTINGWTDGRRERLEDAIDLLERGKFEMDKGGFSETVLGMKGRFRPDPRWTRVWGYFGELILPLWRYARDAPAGAGNALRTFAGDEERALFPLLESYISAAPTPAERGRRLLESVVKSVDDAWNDWGAQGADAMVPDLAPLTDEEVEACTKLLALVRNVILGPIARASGIPLDVDETVRSPRPDDDAKFTWLALNNRIPRSQIPAMIFLSRRLGSDLLPGAAFTKVEVDKDYASALKDPAVGLPPRLAEKFVQHEFLMDHKQRVEAEGYFDSGIEEPGTTELDRAGVAYLFSAKADTSLMVLAPTSAGKSRFGQIALAREVFAKKRQHRKAFGRVVVVVPTKALVTQFARELRQLLADTEAESWEVLEGSRDYPQNDDRIRASRFDIAVIIPEKLAALMRNGMKIERTPLILVDELQHIADGQRGLKEEQLLMEIFARPVAPRFIGLSASLAPATSTLLLNWFAANLLHVDLLEVTARPVPLTVTTLDRESRIESRTHIVGDRTNLDKRLERVKAIGEEQVKSGLPAKQAANKFRVPLALIVDELLGEHLVNGRFSDDTPSVLVFVDSKKNAENLAVGLRELLITRLGTPAPPRRREGEEPISRFPLIKEANKGNEAPYPAHGIRLLPPSRIRRDLLSALETGIGYHTASLNQTGRSIVESLFRRGYVRVLFATDTLRLGINLPADVVINAALHMNIGSAGARLISKDAILQRLGRAGRLGHSRSLGRGFIIPMNPPDGIAIDPHERWEVTGRDEATDAEVLQAVMSTEGLYRAYVHDWTGGAHYTRPLDPIWFDELVTRHLEAIPDRALRVESIQEELASLFGRSLAGVDGADRPDSSAVIERLTRVGAVAQSGDEYRLTDIGRSAAVNALTTRDTEAVKRITAAARQGAGPFTLIYLACTSHHVSTQGNQLQIRPGTSSELVERVMAQIRSTVPVSARPGNRTLFMRHFPDAVSDMIGSGPEADELRRVIESATPAHVDMDDALRLTALWRAWHIYMRFAAVRFEKLENVLGIDMDHWRVDEDALIRYSETAAYIISAASDVLGMNPKTMHFRSLGFFSAEVELGITALLAPFLHLNTPGMDRERLLGMRRFLSDREQRWDGLAELFDLYVSKDNTIPERGNHDWEPLPAATIEAIKAELASFDEGRRGTAYRVIDDIGAMLLPGRRGRRVRDELELIALGQGAEAFADMMKPFDLHARLSEYGDRVTIRFPQEAEHEAQTTTFIFPPRGQTIDNAFVDEVIGELDGPATNAMIVAVDGATHGVINRGRFMLDPVAIIDPALLLELIARVHQRYADAAEQADEDEDVYGGLFGDPTEPTLDVEGARQELRRLFLHNAPVLSRNDLENRLAYREVVVG